MIFVNKQAKILLNICSLVYKNQRTNILFYVIFYFYSIIYYCSCLYACVYIHKCTCVSMKYTHKYVQKCMPTSVQREEGLQPVLNIS